MCLHSVIPLSHTRASTIYWCGRDDLLDELCYALMLLLTRAIVTPSGAQAYSMAVLCSASQARCGLAVKNWVLLIVRVTSDSVIRRRLGILVAEESIPDAYHCPVQPVDHLGAACSAVAHRHRPFTRARGEADSHRPRRPAQAPRAPCLSTSFEEHISSC